MLHGKIKALISRYLKYFFEMSSFFWNISWTCCVSIGMKEAGFLKTKKESSMRAVIIGMLSLSLMAGSGTGKNKDLVDTAIAAGSFKTLVAAVQAAGLVETLKGAGPFTIFAPTDEAFARIPKADLDALLADGEALRNVLTYHVVPGKVMASDVVGLNSAKTVQGQSLAIDTKQGVKVDGANVVKTDILASNGVIHVIDRVVLPK
jgi:uncharacterized surface protein with fasciclin (FAS1) repeats